MRSNFLVIGAARAGTTALYQYLIQHPDIAPAPRKEMHFFDRESKYHNGLAEYKNTFFHQHKDNKITCEATPYYLCHPFVPERVYKHFPNTKIIILVRNPVDRAYSHYNFLVSKKNNIGMSFEQMIECEKSLQKIKVDDDYDDPNSSRRRLFSLVARGEYIDQINRWLKYFPAEQVRIVCSEEFFQNKYKVLDDLWKFLEVDVFDVDDVPERFIGKLNYEPMLPETKRKLTQHFIPFNKRLYKLLNRELEWNDARKKYLNVGCGQLHKQSKRDVRWINIDQFKECNPDIICDITKGIPFGDDKIDYIRAFAMIGQIIDNKDYLNVMNEFWRVLKTGSALNIYVPHKDFDHSYVDPFNRRYFNEDSFRALHYLSNPYKQHLSYYGFKPWILKSIETNNSGFINVNLTPKK